MQGIDKNLAKQSRLLGALSEERFEAVVADTRDKLVRAARNAVREIEIEQEREGYRARIETGCTVDDLAALAASGYRAGVIYPDVPARFKTYSDKGKQRGADRHYKTMTVDELKAMGPVIQTLAAKDCALLYWTSGPFAKQAVTIIESWGFDYKTWAFVWLKTNPSSGALELQDIQPSDLHTGTTYTTLASTEVVLLATRGQPMRLAKDVKQVVIAPYTGRHSEKPDEVRRRIERLYPGPYLELFGRKPVPNWTVWGNEIERAHLRGDAA
jgi:N6-adenosine-specific RNA methylase IME4